MTKRATKASEFESSFIRLLIEDVLTSRDRLAANDTQQSRRDTIRSTFAAIEGVTWMYREHVREIAKDMGVLTPVADMALRERTFSISEQGNIIEQIRFVTLPTIIRLTTKQAQLIDPTVEIDFTDAGWSNLRLAINVRNRITHPKSREDLHVDTAELELVANGFAWLLKSTTIVEAAITQSFRDHIAALRDIIDALKTGDAQAIAEYRQAMLRDDD